MVQRHRFKRITIIRRIVENHINTFAILGTKIIIICPKVYKKTNIYRKNNKQMTFNTISILLMEEGKNSEKNNIMNRRKAYLFNYSSKRLYKPFSSEHYLNLTQELKIDYSST